MVVSPLDLIPDLIPVIGWANDAGSVLRALACAYIGWKQRQRGLTTGPVIDMESTRRGRHARYANASSRYPSAATASQRARKAG